jgi:hypothetical protein
MVERRLTYLIYRCYACHRLLTHFEIEKRWQRAEAGDPQNGVCPCGSGKISPSNAKLWEELFLPRVWKVWWKDIILPKLGR